MITTNTDNHVQYPDITVRPAGRVSIYRSTCHTGAFRQLSKLAPETENNTLIERKEGRGWEMMVGQEEGRWGRGAGVLGRFEEVVVNDLAVSARDPDTSCLPACLPACLPVCPTMLPFIHQLFCGRLGHVGQGRGEWVSE